MVGPSSATPLFANPQPDVLGAGYEALTVELPGDSEGPVVATLVRRTGAATSNRAVLYLHGFSDYFHQLELADFHAARGEDFYALDLRKNGRSLLPHQTPTRMSDVSDYYPELDGAVEFIVGEGHDELVINAHSTGGLIAVLWLHDRRAAQRRCRPGHRGGAEQSVPGRPRGLAGQGTGTHGHSPCWRRTAR